MKKTIYVLSLILLILLALITCKKDKTDENKISLKGNKIIYIVDSYNPATFGWTVQINDGIIKGLEDNGLVQGTDYTIISDTIDAFVNSTEEKMKEQGDRILKDIKEKKPEFVITTDDDAFIYVGAKINDIPVIFNGVNGVPTHYLNLPQLNSIDNPGNNITGVYQISYFTQSLELIKELIPDARNFAVLTDETTTSKALQDELGEIIDDLPLKNIEIFASASFPDWQKKLKSWEGKTDAVLILSANACNDTDGNLMNNDQVVGWIKENSKIPDSAVWEYQIQAGLLVSATDSGIMQGVMTSNKLVEILKGKKPGNIAITAPSSGVPAINMKRAEKLGIEPSEDFMNMILENGVVFK